jgi:predicted nucleic acid-binding protein
MVGTRPVYYWDTCLFLAWLKDEQRKAGEMDAVKDVLERFKRRELTLMTSAITIAEISVAKVSSGTYTLLDDVMQRSNFSRIAVDSKIAKLARDLRDHYLSKDPTAMTLSVPDAIHVASAIMYRANEMHTFDESNNNKQKWLGLIPLSGNVGGHGLTICKPPEPMQGRLALPVTA